ncbi:MAG: glycosyl hydrolase, partial [Saprospiraceae bacterium]|nr:glycosyl hydrolase [Saprospiraceae bacterium]
MSIRHLSRLTLTLSLALCFAVVDAQTYTQQTSPQQREQWYQQHVAMQENSLFRNVPWQFLGPTNISGRMTDVAVVAPKGKNYTIYVAGATGGVWRTQNEGTTWEPVFEHGISTSIGDVTLAPSNQDIIWIGTGEANIFRSSHAGAGVYKSTDGGETWEHKGLTDTKTIPRIVIHPKNPDVVYVASTGNEWTDNPSRGLYLTRDGGNSWDKIFYV